MGLPDNRSNAGGAPLQQLLFVTPLSGLSLGRFWARGESTEGVSRLRTSGFRTPVLGDLEAMDLDTLEYYNLVAKSPLLNSLVAPKGPADPRTHQATEKNSHWTLHVALNMSRCCRASL